MQDVIVSHGSYLKECTVEHSIIGVRSRINEGCVIKVRQHWVLQLAWALQLCWLLACFSCRMVTACFGKARAVLVGSASGK